MPLQLTDVVAWVPRIYPPRKVIPPELKLAILTRGRIRLPAATAEWFMEQSRLNNGTLPKRLPVLLENIADDFPVTVELFLNQRIHMGAAEITESLTGYLALRRKRHLSPGCHFLLFSWMTADRRRELERVLDLDISLLFRKAKVHITPRTDPNQYVLVAYVCLPPEVEAFLLPEPVPIPELPAGPPPLDPLIGRTNVNARVHLREGPTPLSHSLGVLAGVSVLVKVTEKVKGEVPDGYPAGAPGMVSEEQFDHTWYRIELLERLRVTPGPDSPLKMATYWFPGKQAWIAEIGIDFLVATWDRFRNDVYRFEFANSQLSLQERITLFRQITSKDDLPVDHVLGAAKGKVYRNTLPFVADRWQLSRDYIVVEAPDGRWVEIGHIAAGMDALWRPEKTALINDDSVGTTWSAVTWAGDVGSAAGDATARTLKASWERWHPKATDVERIEFYMQVQAPEHELLGDIDAWGIIDLMQGVSEANTIDKVLALYYTELSTGSLRTLTRRRADALTRLLKHYGFSYHASTDFAKFPVLPAQRKPVQIAMSHVYRFARMMFWYRYPYVLLSNDPAAKEPRHVLPATQLFLFWLEQTAAEHGVDTG